MSGNGVVMMQKFIEANGLVNSESPAIFVEVHKALEKKLKRIDKIKAIYEEDGEQAPMTKCPHCGSPSLIVRNCEFCGYSMLEGESSDEVVMDEPKEKPRTTRRGANNNDNEPEIKENIVETKAEVVEEKPKTTRGKKESVVPTKEEINKARRPGLKKIATAHKIDMTVDMDKAELKEIRTEMLSILLGETAPVTENKKRSKVATKKKDIASPAIIDFSKAPNQEKLEAMTEEQLIKVIADFRLPLVETKTKLEGEIESDDAFFDCVDEIIASLKSEEENQSKVEEPVSEVKTRNKRTKPAKKEVKEELVKISIDDLPEASALEAMTEKQLSDVITKFGLDLKDEVKTLASGKLSDDAFFKIVDAIDAKIEEIANDINDGKEPKYPATLEVKEKKTARTKKPQASEPVLEAGTIDEAYEDIDLDNADIDYDDINIEDIASEA